MFLNEGVHHVGVPTQFLLGDKIVKLADRKGLNRILVAVEVSHSQVDHSVDAGAGPDPVLKAFGIFPDKILVEFPSALRAVPNGGLRRELADQFVVLYILQSEAVGGVVP